MNILTKRKFSSFNMYVFFILIAFELLMSFTFLGYLHFEPISVTFAYIPILVAACLLGTVQSTLVGAAFGLASMYKSSVYYAFQADSFFSPFLSGNPIGSLVLSVGSRVLFGFLTGLAFGWAKKQRRAKNIAIGFVSLVSPSVHAALVLTAMEIFFPGTTRGYFSSPYLVLSNIILSLICVVIVEFFWKQYTGKTIMNIKYAVDFAKNIPYIETKNKRVLISMFTIFVLSMTIAAAMYFSDRMFYMLRMHNMEVSAQIGSDLVNLQIQFMIAMISLGVISVMILVLGYQYTAYKNFLGELDAVTNVMGRRIFLNCCERALKSDCAECGGKGWFLFLDVDHFKKINDTMGHAEGDKVLKKIALLLKSKFFECGIVGRMGGDEFAVMIDKRDISETEMKKLLEDFQTEVTGVSEHMKVSCSIGACRFSAPAEMSLLMNRTDALLYKAKQNGRACSVLGVFDKQS